MQEYFDVALHGRSREHSATAGVAYRVGQDLVEGPTGEEHLYGHREKDVLEHDIVGGTFESPQAWADAIEDAETRVNSQFYRDIKLALPCELSQECQVELARQWSASLADRYHTSVLFAVHRADGKGDQRNTHAHCLLPTRQLSSPGSFTRGAKLRRIDRDTLRTWRANWNLMQRDALAEALINPDTLRTWRADWNLMQRPELTRALQDGDVAQEHHANVALDLLWHLDHPTEYEAEMYRQAALQGTPAKRRKALNAAMPTVERVASDNQQRRQLQGQLTLTRMRLEGLQARYAALQARRKEADTQELRAELAQFKTTTRQAQWQRKAIREQLAEQYKGRRYTTFFFQATAAGHPDPEQAAEEAMSQPKVHLGPAAVALERAAATEGDKDDARAARRSYAPIRRSVAALLAYTTGVSKRGKLWLSERPQFVHLKQSCDEAKAAFRRTMKELRKLTGRPRKFVAERTRLQPAAAPAGGPRAPPPDLEG